MPSCLDFLCSSIRDRWPDSKSQVLHLNLFPSWTICMCLLKFDLFVISFSHTGHLYLMSSCLHFMCWFSKLFQLDLKLHFSHVYFIPSWRMRLWILIFFPSAVVYGHKSHWIFVSVCLLFTWLSNAYFVIIFNGHLLHLYLKPSCFVWLCFLTWAAEP